LITKFGQKTRSETYVGSTSVIGNIRPQTTEAGTTATLRQREDDLLLFFLIHYPVESSIGLWKSQYVLIVHTLREDAIKMSSSFTRLLLLPSGSWNVSAVAEY